MATWKTPNTSHTVEDQVTPDIFNTLAENEIYLKDTKIVSSQVQDGAVTSTESTTRANIASGDTVKVAFGKLRKWFSDFGVLCFLDKVDTDQIEATSVTMGKIASNAVSTGKLDGLAVTTAKIANAAVTDVKLAVNSVITEKILDLAVTTSKLADLAVTSVKLATSAVTTAKIADLNVTTAKLANGSVTTAKLADGAVTDIKVSNVAASKITGDIHAATADAIFKNSSGSYLTATIDSSGYAQLSDGSTVRRKKPLYVSTIGTYYEDYQILSGDTFPTGGKLYEIIYEDNGINQYFRYRFPTTTSGTLTIYFSLLFNVHKSTYDFRIQEAGSTTTYKSMKWVIDFTNKTVKQTKYSGGSCAATTVYFKGIYELLEQGGA